MTLLQPFPLMIPVSSLLGLLLLGVPCSGSAAEAGDPLLITHGSRSAARVALTFDLCQTPGKAAGFDRQIMAILKQEQAPATFFVGGEWLDRHPAEAQELAAEPRFELGNHSQTHPDLRKLTAKEIAAELSQTEARLIRLTGHSSRLFRLPFGWHDQRVLREVDLSGMRIIQWDVVTGDPDPKVTAAAIRAEVQRKARNGSIIIMHANGRGWHTAEALAGLITDLRSKGFELVTVSELLGKPAGAD